MSDSRDCKGICLVPSCAGKKPMLARNFPRHYRKVHQEFDGDGNLVEATKFKPRLTKRRFFQPVGAGLTMKRPVEAGSDTNELLEVQNSVITELQDRVSFLEKFLKRRAAKKSVQTEIQQWFNSPGSCS